MDFVEQLGEKAIISRMRRLMERMVQDTSQIFKDYQLPFESKWFLLLSLLDNQSPLSIMEISKELRVKHPSVNQLAKEIIKRGFIEEVADKHDKRKRLLKLTPKGEELLYELKPIWEDMTAAAHEVIQNCGYDFIAVMASVENVLDQQSYYERIKKHIKTREWNKIKIIPYESQHKSIFLALNDSWLSKESELDSQTKKFLSNPELINKDGIIFLAHYNDKIIGTCALIGTENKNTYKINYIAVDKNFQNKQIGTKLVKATIDYASTLKASEIIAQVNHQLNHAINLLRKQGFLTAPINQLDTVKLNSVLLKLSLS